MKTENLEALLIDREVGELPLATAELLDEYLRSNPAAAVKAQEISVTLGLAGEAMRSISSRELRPFPREVIAREQCLVNWRGRTFQALKLAACVALGISLGWFGKPSPDARASATVPLPKPDYGTRMVVADKKPESAGGFWSLARFEAQKKTAKPSEAGSRYQLHLESPLNLQKLEEKL